MFFRNFLKTNPQPEIIDESVLQEEMKNYSSYTDWALANRHRLGHLTVSTYAKLNLHLLLDMAEKDK